MVALATAATVIASQAVITGAYSLVRQAIQLGLLPRLAIMHTSDAYSGQIYIPRVNTALLVGVLLLVGLFRTSSALASAYGIAVATTMVVDGVLGFVVIWKLWGWRWWQAALLIGPLVMVDATYFSANLLKIFEGAWVPLLFGISMVLLIITWRRGTNIVTNKTRRSEVRLEKLVRNLEKRPPHIVPGTAIFLTSDPDFAPTALMHNLKHNKILHEHNVILTIITDGYSARGRRRPGDDYPSFKAVQPGCVKIRFYGNTECAKSAGGCSKEGLELRHNVDVVLLIPTCATASSQVQYATMAGSALHWSRAKCERRNGLFPNPN